MNIGIYFFSCAFHATKHIFLPELLKAKCNLFLSSNITSPNFSLTRDGYSNF